MDKDKIYQRIMLLKIIQSSGFKTPYEMDLNLVGNVLLGKYYKIFMPPESNPDRVLITGTIRIDPESVSKLFSMRLTTFLMFFKRGNDLHLVHIGGSYINSSSRQMMNKINAERIYYYPVQGNDKQFEFRDFESIDNIYYHPTVSIEKNRLSFNSVLEAFQLKYANLHRLLFECRDD